MISCHLWSLENVLQACRQLTVRLAILLIHSAQTYYRSEKRIYINPVERKPNDPQQGLMLMMVQSKVVLHKSRYGMSMAMKDAKSRLINTLINDQSTH
jgi:hypothetical protein